MDIYTNSTDRQVSLDVPVTANGPVEVTVSYNDETVFEPTQINHTDSVYSFNLPFAFCQADKSFEVRWTFSYQEDGFFYEFDETFDLNVVTPILTLPEINDLVKDDEDWTTEELAQIERAVRLIIQSHTGQSFGKFVGTHSVTGGGESDLRLPQRLITLNTINGNDFNNENVNIRGGGWYLSAGLWNVPTIRSDYYGWHENPYTSPVPIAAPYSRELNVFIMNREYEIDGVWGWKSVPSAVREAARLLVNDYACAEIAYRDRFLESMQAADWKIQFNEGAYSNTGNVRANQLLAEFVLRRGWLVI